MLGLLACPVCRGNLRQQPDSLICAICVRAFPIIDGIPVLIAKRAEPRSENEPLEPVNLKRS